MAPDPIPRWDPFHEEIDTAPVTDDELATLHAAADAITSGQYSGTTATNSPIAAVLNTGGSAVAPEAALSHVAAAVPGLYAVLRNRVLPDVYRSLHP